ILGKLECRWISDTNGDNGYGSELVDRVINAPNLALLHSDSGDSRGNSGSGSSNTGSSGRRQADMLLVPMDSRNFADKDLILRKDLGWDRKCLGIQVMLAISGMAYNASPVPKITRVDLAAIFLRRDKLLAENVWFSNFSDAKCFNCIGYNNGYFKQYLVRNRGWTYTRLPIDDLRSVMFHEPSPTHCIAAGHVWFDHPKENGVGCFGHEQVKRMLCRDLGRQYGTPPQVPYFIWVHYNNSDRVCLCLSKYRQEDIYRSRRLREGGAGAWCKVHALQSQARTQPQTQMHRHRQLKEFVPVEPMKHAMGVRTEQQAVAHYLTGQTAAAHAHSGGRAQHGGQVLRSYLLLNPDLQKEVPEAEAIAHYERVGRNEKHECVSEWVEYLVLYEDMLADIRTEVGALRHYVAKEDFDWMAYLELNEDLYLGGMDRRPPVQRQFNNAGMDEGRAYTQPRPAPACWASAVAKLHVHLQTSGATHAQQNLVIYNIEDIGGGGSGGGGGGHKAFYLFNAAALTDNPALALLPQLPNVAVVHWTYFSPSLNTFLRTLHVLGSRTSALDAVFHLNSGVRGHLAQYQAGRRISQYRDLLDGAGVGLVQPIIDCSVSSTPYLQPHEFALRRSLIAPLLQKFDKYYNSSRVFVPVEDYFRFRLTALVPR
ncbi:hypothetical protein B484DRAFT_397249, partial [Ochromonadaceae sp. CCMP2298]